MAILTTIIVGIVVTFASDQVKALLPFLSQNLLKFAVSRLPEVMRERYREEWAADLLDYPGEFVKCLRALGLCWASARISRSARKTLVNIIVEKLFWWLFRVYLKLFLTLLTRKLKSATAELMRAKLKHAQAAQENGAGESLPSNRPSISDEPPVRQ
ncbi:MAG: hypothetical protein ABR987_03680 [Terracidiphilus sp.]|jgi:hypothetical protein